MLNINHTTKLLNLEDEIITNVENFSDGLHIHLEQPRRAHACPVCGVSTSLVHDYRDMQRLSIMFDLAPRLADVYQLKNEFVAAMQSRSFAQSRERLLLWFEHANLSLMIVNELVTIGSKRFSTPLMSCGRTALPGAAIIKQRCSSESATVFAILSVSAIAFYSVIHKADAERYLPA